MGMIKINKILSKIKIQDKINIKENINKKENINIKENINKKENINTTDEDIKDLMSKYNRVLLITDDKYYSSHFKLKFIQILPIIKETLKLILHPSKFILLSWQGFLDVLNYDLIIINCELKMDLIHAFRVFYIDNLIYDINKPLCLVYTDKKMDDLPIYFQSIIENNKLEKPFYKCYSLDLEINQNIIDYVKCTRILKELVIKNNNENYIKLLKELSVLEKRNLEDAYSLLMKFIDCKKIKNINEKEEDMKIIKDLIIFHKKKDIVNKYLKEERVILKSKNDLINYFNINKFDIKIIDYKLDLSTSDINSNNSILIIWDEDDEEEIIQNYKKIIFFKISGEYPNNFLKLIKNNEKIGKFINYSIKKDKEYRIDKIRPVSVLSWEYSVLFLEHILYLIGRVFHDNYLYIRSIKVNRFYELSLSGDKYICYLEFPNIVENEIFKNKYKSEEFNQKKDAMKDVSYKTLIRLIEAGYLDNNFLPVKSKFIDRNSLYFKYIKEIYEIDIENNNLEYNNLKDINLEYNTLKDNNLKDINLEYNTLKDNTLKDINLENILKKLKNIKEEYEDGDYFKKEFSFDLYDFKNQISLDVDEILRKQADSMKNFVNTVSLYIFNNSNLGICTDKSFKETILYKNVEVSFIKEITFSNLEREIIFNYQIIFFGINFRRVTNIDKNMRKYKYLVVPIKNNNIDFDYMKLINNNFFIGNVYSVQDRNILNNYLLFNPITKSFYEYLEESDKKLSDMTSEKIKFNKDRSDTIKYNKDKSNATKYNNGIFNIDKADKNIDKANINIDKKYYNFDKEINEEYSYQEYFKRLYGINLTNIIDDTNIIFKAIPYTTKNKEKKEEYHSGEIIYVTTIKKNIKLDYKRFIEYFNIFETISLINEFKINKKLNISLNNLILAFSPREIIDGITDLGYERFEFIGDSVLKYATSKYLFTECGYSLNRLVSTKDSIICNNHLYQIGRKIELQKYFSFNKYSENLFQPPAILEEIKDKSFINNLGVIKTFLNNNQYYFVKEYSKKQVKEEDIEKGRKVYADIVESLIGVHYVEFGFEKAWEFIKEIGIVESKNNINYDVKFDDSISNNFSINNSINNSISNIYLLCDYEGILPYSSIQIIEDIINYKFTNKGYLEKAMIHPSYKNNIFGSERFQKLELVGDCFLDLKVSDYIYKKYTSADPCELHTHRKKLVNNYTFAMILFKTKLVDLSLTGLDEKTRNIQNNKISKCYSDILESLAGAVVLDSGFNLEKMEDFFKRILKYMEENTHDC